MLDLGCGTGRHTVFLAGQGFRVFGFDWSEASIARTRAELSKGGLDANLAVWDMTSTPYPYPDSHFDAVFAVRVIQHALADSISKAALEIARVTRKGGRLYLEVPTPARLARQKREGVPFRKCEAGTWIPLGGDEKGVPHHFFKRGELASLFSGFTSVEIDEQAEHFILTATRA